MKFYFLLFFTLPLICFSQISQGNLANPTTCGGSDGFFEILGSGTGDLIISGTITDTLTVTLPYTVTNLSQGYYEFIFNDGTSASNLLSNFVLDPPLPNPPVISSTFPSIVCPGTEFQIQSNYMGGNQWSNSSGLNTISTTIPGTYFARYLDANNCLSLPSNSITISNYDFQISLASNQYEMTCADSLGIQILGNISFEGDIYVQKFIGTSWQEFDTIYEVQTDDEVNFVDGFYRIQMLTTEGCWTNDVDFNIDSYNPPFINIISNEPSFCEGDSLQLFTYAQNPTLSWSTGQTGQSIWIHEAGNYFVTLLDGNCVISSDTLHISTINKPTIDVGEGYAVCFGEEITLNAQSNGVNGHWSNNISNNVPFVFTGIGVTSFVYYDQLNGCSNSDTIVLFGWDLPNINTSRINPTACSATDGSIEVLSTNVVTGDVYWTGPTSGNAYNVSFPYTIPNLGQGVYSVYVSSSTCDSPVSYVSLSDPASISDISVDEYNKCEGDSIQLISYQSSNILWSNGMTNDTIYVTQSGYYSVTHTDGNCVSNSSSVYVQFLEKPNLQILSTTNPSTCGGQDGMITYLSNSYGYLLLTMGNDIDTSNTYPGSFDLTSLTAGTYYLQIVGGFCNSDVVSFELNDPGVTQPTITSSGNNVCYGDSITITSSSPNSVWSTGETTQSITVSSSGTYSVLEHIGTCTSSSALFVAEVKPQVFLAFNGPIDFCEGQTATLIAQTQGADVLWSNGSTNQGIEIDETTTGWLIASDDGCYSDTIAFFVEEVHSLVTPISDLSICNGESIDINLNQQCTWYAIENPNVIGESILPQQGNFIQDHLELVDIRTTEVINYLYFTSNGHNNQCNSDTLSFTVTINYKPDMNYTISNDTIFVAETNATTTWYSCNNGNFDFIANSNFLYVVPSSGQFAFVNTVLGTGCQDTSACITVNLVYLNQLEDLEANVYPNPLNSDKLYVEFKDNSPKIIQILNIEGKLIEKRESAQKVNILDFSNYMDGAYFILIISENQETKVHKIFKN